MNTNSTALDIVNELEQFIRYSVFALLTATGYLSYLGAYVIVPATGWQREAMAIGLAITVFFTIKVLITSQKIVFPALRRKSRAAIGLLVVSIALILGISGSTNLVGLLNAPTALRAMEDGQNHSEMIGAQAKRATHSVTSLSALLINAQDKAGTLSKRAAVGEITPVKGYGPVAKRYAAIAGELDGLTDMIEETMSKGETLIHGMDSAATRMGSIIKQDIPLDEKVLQFEIAQRDYANHYNRLAALNLADQLRVGLGSLTDSSLVESADGRMSRKALQKAEAFAQDIVNDISIYLDANLEPLPELEAYEQPSPSIASFTYARYYIPQVALAFGPDIALIILVLLRIVAAQDGENDPDNNPRVDLKQLQLLAGAIKEINNSRMDTTSRYEPHHNDRA